MSTITTVYRLQTDANVGPYDGAITREWEERVGYSGDDDEAPSYFTNYYAEHRPVPVFDRLTRVRPEEFFGFATPEDLRNWFLESERDAALLSSVGLKVYAYQIQDHFVRYGDTQAVFEHSLADVLTTFEVTELAELLA